MHDDSLMPFYISLTLLLALLVVFIVSYLLVHKQKQNAYQAEKERTAIDHQNKLLTARVEEQERTMEQISTELHDHVGQVLSLVKMSMFVVSKDAVHAAQKDTIENVKTMLDQLIVDVRNISHSLNGEFIKKRGLVALLEEELGFINTSGSIKCSLEIEGDRTVFKAEKELLIYRIVQEALHNATKHARANKLVVKLKYLPDSFAMSIADDGVGFDMQEVYALKGVGLLNMMQRAKLLNGTLDVLSAPQAGSTITLRVANPAELI